MKLADHLPSHWHIARGYCRICNIVGTIVIQPESFSEPLTCNAGHVLELSVPGKDVMPHEGDERV